MSKLFKIGESSYFLKEGRITRIDEKNDVESFSSSRNDFEDFLLRLMYDLEEDFGYDGIAEFLAENPQEIALLNDFFNSYLQFIFLDELKKRVNKCERAIKEIEKEIAHATRNN